MASRRKLLAGIGVAWSLVLPGCADGEEETDDDPNEAEEEDGGDDDSESLSSPGR